MLTQKTREVAACIWGWKTGGATGHSGEEAPWGAAQGNKGSDGSGGLPSGWPGALVAAAAERRPGTAGAGFRRGPIGYFKCRAEQTS